jgi:hypothetical protein
VGDFVEETALEELEPEDRADGASGGAAEGDGLEPMPPRRYRAELVPDWRTWGPLGGYVAAIALRAAGMATSFDRPASFRTRTS